jgi:hypothetical protein
MDSRASYSGGAAPAWYRLPDQKRRLRLLDFGGNSTARQSGWEGGTADSGVHDGQIVPIDIVPEDGHMDIVARDFVSYLRVTRVNGRRSIGARLLVSGGEYVG